VSSIVKIEKGEFLKRPFRIRDQVIKSLKGRFNTGMLNHLFRYYIALIEGDIVLLALDECWDPHAIAGLLKSSLRELHASNLTCDLHMRSFSVIGRSIFLLPGFELHLTLLADFVEPQERIRGLSDLIASVPIANYSLLRALTAH
jgi:RalA-binding protein 1